MGIAKRGLLKFPVATLKMLNPVLSGSDDNLLGHYMNKFITLLAAALVAVSAASSAQAQETASFIPGDFTANAALTSDYIFRGISQSDEGPAIQGGFDYTYNDEQDGFPGFYAGIWASNVDFNDGDEASVELDVYAGLQGTIDQLGSDWKLGGIYYAYPGADDDLNYDFWEVAGSLTHDFGPLILSGAINYSPEYFGETGDAWYFSYAASVPLPYDFTFNAHLGYQDIEDGVDYYDWSAGLGYSWNGFNFAVNYIDTDLDEPEECADGCSERVVFTVSKAF